MAFVLVVSLTHRGVLFTLARVSDGSLVPTVHAAAPGTVWLGQVHRHQVMASGQIFADHGDIILQQRQKHKLKIVWKQTNTIVDMRLCQVTSVWQSSAAEIPQRLKNNTGIHSRLFIGLGSVSTDWSTLRVQGVGKNIAPIFFIVTTSILVPE